MVLNSILTKSQLSIQNISLGQWRAWRQRAQLSWAGVVRVAPASASAVGFPAFLPFFFFFHFIFPVVFLSQILEAVSWFLLCHRQAQEVVTRLPLHLALPTRGNRAWGSFCPTDSRSAFTLGKKTRAFWWYLLVGTQFSKVYRVRSQKCTFSLFFKDEI